MGRAGALVRDAVEKFHRPDEGISIAVGPSGPQRCTDEMLGCAALADELDLVIHIHVLETRMQAVSGQKMYGKTLVEHMDAIGFLGPRVCFAHGIWLTPRDIEIVRDRDVSIAHNPVSNMKLARNRRGSDAFGGGRERRPGDGRDVLERRTRHVRVAQAGRAAAQAVGIDYERWTGALEAWQLATIGGARGGRRGRAWVGWSRPAR